MLKFSFYSLFYTLYRLELVVGKYTGTPREFSGPMMWAASAATAVHSVFLMFVDYCVTSVWGIGFFYFYFSRFIGEVISGVVIGLLSLIFSLYFYLYLGYGDKIIFLYGRCSRKERCVGLFLGSAQIAIVITTMFLYQFVSPISSPVN